MLYLRNTNQLQSLSQLVNRGPAASLISSSVSASYTTNSSSLFVLLNDATTKLSTTASATTNFLAAPNSVVSASLSATTPSSSVSMSLFISASNGSLLFTGSSTGSAIMTSFIVGSDVRYTISSSFNRVTANVGNTPGLYRTSYTGYFGDDPNWFATATPISGGVNLSPLALGTFTGSGNNFSLQWLGYFIPNTSETYSFYLGTDDASYLWLGSAATASTLFTSSALVQNPGTHSFQTETGSIGLVSGSLYAIRVQYGENQGGEIFSMSISTPTIPKTENVSGSIYYNSGSNGF